VNTATKLASFAAVVAIAFGGAAAVGAGVGPIDVGDRAATHDEMTGSDDTPAASTSGDRPRGLAVAEAGYRFVGDTTDLTSGASSTFGFSIVDDSGAAVTGFDQLHERRLHLIVVSRNLVDFHHLHPEMDVSGRWTIDMPALDPGSYRVFADFQPEGGRNLTLGTDISVSGEVAAIAVPDPATTIDVDGYTVTMKGEPHVGQTDLSFTVELDGQVVTTDGYLGAAGHLVAIRAGDLAYLHVHPHDGTGSVVTFTNEFPTAGTYRLFLDFSHDDAVRTATFTVTVPDAGDGEDPTSAHQEGH
jgi:hypothetical protein